MPTSIIPPTEKGRERKGRGSRRKRRKLSAAYCLSFPLLFIGKKGGGREKRV